MEDTKEGSQQRKVPVFTVMKKGMIVKNIFLFNAPQPDFDPQTMGFGENLERSSEQRDGEEKEEILIVGRHPDCNLMLEHPSISRFHLRIHSKPSSQKLSVIDLSSVHGTWVSDEKIEPMVQVEMNEGDTLRLGSSTRVYRLHWFPLDRAFNVESSFLSPILENPSQSEEKEMSQNENFSPSAPPLPGNMDFSFLDDDGVVLQASPVQMIDENQSHFRVLEERKVLGMWSESVSSCSLPVGRVLSEALDKSEEFDKENQENVKMGFVENVLVDIGNEESPLRKSEKKSDKRSIWSRRGKPASLIRIETGRSKKKNAADSGVEAEKEYLIKHGAVSKVLFPGSDGDEEIFTPDKENFTPKTALGSKSSKKGRIEEIKSGRKSSRSSVKAISYSNQVKDRGDEIVPTVLFSDSDGEEEIFTPDKENSTPLSMRKCRAEDSKDRYVFGSLSSKANGGTNQDEKNGMLTFLENENLTPIVYRKSVSKPPTSVERLRKEGEMIMNKRKEGRVPFQTLVVNSISKSKSEARVANVTTTSSSNSVSCGQTAESSLPSPNQPGWEVNRRWYMVADTRSLLNKDSRRSLQLLQGLKGTQLIIPRMVIRELECLQNRGSLFRRETEASMVFKWIEECMVKTNWWIHVQNSIEEGLPTAPTPPASSVVNGEGSSSGTFSHGMPFFPCGSLMEIVSPTAQDHILECALLFKRIKTDGKVVLLTNDVALKIKSMAEGLLCETAEEFRESLVNPWSDRFLWVESTPRGPTWSCFEEANLLRENYQHLHVKKTTTATEGVKGLKLILLHNSQYGQMNSFNREY